ncbi:MAG TPA: kelch repeat-containing protein, partial [Thermoplasmata archaeon]|nr:kelch repeat-containing protein [Thermoplasmata archaeon]
MRRLRGRSWRVASLLALGALVVLAVFPMPATRAASPPAASPASAAVSATTAPPPPIPETLAAPAPAATPIFNWGLAYIYYGPGDDKTHFLGEGAAMVVDDQSRNITTFGGEGAGGLTPYTMDYNYSTGAFNVTVLNPTPSARTNVSFASVPGRNFAVLFGGLTNLSTDRTTNDTWVYDFLNQTWRNVTHTLAPPAREGGAFAVNASGGTALLEGGWDPSATIGGSPASVFWNDTWTLNLTTFDWTELHPVVAPPPLYGSGMIWQNATNQFDLFGGCALTCSADVWSFGGQPAHWTKVSAIGSIPAARGSPAFAWDAVDHLAVLFGGFSWGAGGAIALGSGSLFAPATRSWTPLSAGGGPGPVYDAPNAWAEFPGCQGLVLAGGNTALAGPPTNASVLERFAGNFTNCFPDLISGGSSPPPPPCSAQSTPLQVRVIDNLTGKGIPNASVSYSGRCVDNQQGTTNSYGELQLTLPAPDLLNFTAIATGYRAGALQAILLPNTSSIVTISLTPYPSLTVHASGVGISGIPY